MPLSVTRLTPKRKLSESKPHLQKQKDNTQVLVRAKHRGQHKYEVSFHHKPKQTNQKGKNEKYSKKHQATHFNLHYNDLRKLTQSV